MTETLQERINKHLIEVQNHYDMWQYDWFVIALCGSQNYGLDNENSDVDTKCLLIPTIEQVFLNRPAVSTTLHINDEHCNVTDVREYMKILRKGAINFVEILFTDYFIVNQKYSEYWKMLRLCREYIARVDPYRTVKSTVGMAIQKNKEFVKKLSDGLDPRKDLMTLYRLKYFLSSFIDNKPYKDCIFQDQDIRKFLLNTKNLDINKLDFLLGDMIVNKMVEREEEFLTAEDVRAYPEAEQIIDAYTIGLMKTVARTNYAI